MTERARLPDRRKSITETFDLDGLACIATASYFEDGRLAEIFLRAGKPGSAADVAAHDGAVAISLALQHGVPVAAVKHALERLDDGRGAGPLGRALDLVAHGHGGGDG